MALHIQAEQEHWETVFAGPRVVACVAYRASVGMDLGAQNQVVEENQVAEEGRAEVKALVMVVEGVQGGWVAMEALVLVTQVGQVEVVQPGLVGLADQAGQVEIGIQLALDEKVFDQVVVGS